MADSQRLAACSGTARRESDLPPLEGRGSEGGVAGDRRSQKSDTRSQDAELQARTTGQRKRAGAGEGHVSVSPPDADIHCQSSIVRPSISRKCASRVIRVRLCCRAIAAIQISLSGIGRPCLRRASLIAP